MGAEKINLDELRKAREELNIELGITTPEPKKQPKVEKPVAEEKSVETPSTESSSVPKKEETINNPVISVQDDDFDELDIEAEVEKYINSQVEQHEEAVVVERDTKLEEENNFSSQIEKLSENVESNALVEEQKEMNEFNNLIDSLEIDKIEDESSDVTFNLPKEFDEEVKSLETEKPVEEKTETKPVENNLVAEQKAELMKTLQANLLYSQNQAEPQQTEKPVTAQPVAEPTTPKPVVEPTTPKPVVEPTAQKSVVAAQPVAEPTTPKPVVEPTAQKPVVAAQPVAEPTAQKPVVAEKPVEKTEKPAENAEKDAKSEVNDTKTAPETANSVSFGELNTEKSPFDEDFEFKPIFIPNIEVNVNKGEDEKSQKVEEEKVNAEDKKEELNEEPKQDENKVGENENQMMSLDVNAKTEPEKSEEALEDKSNKLKKIGDAKFINLIRTKSFMSSDSLTCIYGTDEVNEVFCQNFKDFYNTAIFCEKDENIFELFSSIMMSLLLKNTKFDVRFAICDSKIGTQFSVYNNLSYMFFDRVAESNREIIEALKEICHEIDSRYKSLAKAGAKSIESFNTEMKKAKIAPLPYLILFFNNYTRAYNLDDSHEINNNLSYILRFGRLVGVYVNLVSFDENLPENINFNLQTRIAYRTELKETSIAEICEEGAENIGYDDEFIIKTLYSDKLIHLKAPKITQKEIELLIKNIEKK